VSRITASQGDNAQLAQKQGGLFFSFPLPGDVSPRLSSVLRKHERAVAIHLRPEQRRVVPASPTCLSLNFIRALNSTKVVAVNSPILAPSVNVPPSLRVTPASSRQPEDPCNPQGVRGQRIEGPPREMLTYISSPADQLGPVVGGVISDVANGFNFG